MIEWIVFVVVALVATVAIVRYQNRTGISGVAMSWPAKELLSMYNMIPPENRPTSNIKDILVALDIKHGGVDSVDTHFTRNYAYSSETSWNHGPCRTNVCEDYTSIKDEIRGVLFAVSEQEQALKTAAVQGRLEQAKDLVARLSEESSIIKQTTKELKGML